MTTLASVRGYIFLGLFIIYVTLAAALILTLMLSPSMPADHASAFHQPGHQ